MRNDLNAPRIPHINVINFIGVRVCVRGYGICVINHRRHRRGGKGPPGATLELTPTILYNCNIAMLREERMKK